MEPYIAFLIGAYLIYLAKEDPEGMYRGRYLPKLAKFWGRKNLRIIYFLLGIFFIFAFLWHISRNFVS